MGDGYKAKICGTTNLADVRLSADAGADYFGAVIEVDFSPRSLTIAEAKPLFSVPPIPAVALVFNMPEDRISVLLRELAPHALQFLNPADPALIKRLKRETPAVEIWQSIHLPQVGNSVDMEAVKTTVETYLDAGVDALLFDTAAVSQGQVKYGGTGRISDWQVVKALMDKLETDIPIWLAGGISPDNVGAALDAIAPYGIDLCSGVEAGPGKKDPAKVKALMNTIKEKSIKGSS